MYGSLGVRIWHWPFVCLIGFAMFTAGCTSSAPSIYSVADYDPGRDPAADLAATVAQARPAHKRILIQVGGQWCVWCHKLDRFIAEHPQVTEALRNNYIVMKVNYSDENQNADFIAQYPKVPGYPHLYVLESDGSFLHSQPTAELEDGSSYSETALLDFLQTWSPG
jgi:thiol:disulfide interchange protein